MSRSHEIWKEEKARDLSHAASRAEDNVANLRKIQGGECDFKESIEKLQSVWRWLERQIKDDLAPPLLPEYQAQRTAELQPL
ncbi:MAG: hypothetical protein J2P36_28495, partial [Ktedonobacteraceae bacterium]|nr:hypothetical protein [Ktedonobacteraceae bacterium]